MLLFLHSRYHVNASGITAYEAITGPPYSGRIVQFGESVMCHVKTVGRGVPRWVKAVWLTRVGPSDMHLVHTSAGLMLTRSIRRMPEKWNSDMLNGCSAQPWSHPGHLGGMLGAVRPREAVAAKAFEGAELDDGAALASLLVPQMTTPMTPDEAASDPETLAAPLSVSHPDGAENVAVNPHADVESADDAEMQH